MSKKDAELGKRVHAHLVELGLETPMVDMTEMDNTLKIDRIAEHVKGILQILALDLTDDSLSETPVRVAKMYVNEIFSGLDYNNFPKCTVIENKFSGVEDFVLEKDITLYSACEHHLLTIQGTVDIAYIPGAKVIGLSKLNRIVQFFAQRPQVQERLTQQIAAAIAFVTGSDDVVVRVSAKHLCVAQRGIKDTTSSTVTMKAMGQFESNATLRSEFVRNVLG